jgi:hypothetical protein
MVLPPSVAVILQVVPPVAQSLLVCFAAPRESYLTQR